MWSFSNEQQRLIQTTSNTQVLSRPTAYMGWASSRHVLPWLMDGQSQSVSFLCPCTRRIVKNIYSEPLLQKNFLPPNPPPHIPHKLTYSTCRYLLMLFTLKQGLEKALRMGWAPTPSTCHTGTSYIQCPPTSCFVHRVDAKLIVLRLHGKISMQLL